MDLIDQEAAVVVSIYGIASALWFGWAQERPPAGARWWLGGGAFLGLLLAAFGGYQSWLLADTGSAPDEGNRMVLFNIIVGVEFGVGLLGVIILWAAGRREYAAPWILLVVGVHFLPLAPIFDSPSMYVMGVLLTAWSFVAVRWANRRDLAYSLTSGAGAGVILLGASAVAAAGLLFVAA